MLTATRQAFSNWIFRHRGAETGPIFLNQRRVFILPTWHGLLMLITLVTMLIASINYTLNLGLALTFLLGAISVVSILHTFRNLAHLTVTAGRAEPVFLGETAWFEVRLSNPGRHDRYAVGTRPDGKTLFADAMFTDLPAGEAATVRLPFNTTRRGWARLPKLKLETRYPLGLTRAWSYVQPDLVCLVYPKPEPISPPPLQSAANSGRGVAAGSGTDDFSGLRNYQVSDSPRQVAWRISARGDALLTKLFSGQASAEQWFDWDAMPLHLDEEWRLSRMTRWVIEAEIAGRNYGLRLPGWTSGLGQGDAHQQTCLRQLALFGIDTDG